MDMSFAGQAFASEYMWKNKDSLEHKVYKLPDELDQEIARLKLKAEKVEIDSLSAKQKKYLESWREGT